MHWAEANVERDKERGEGIVKTMPTTNDDVAAHVRPAPKGKPLFCPSDCVAPPRHSLNYVSSSRLAYGQNLGFQIPITYALVSKRHGEVGTPWPLAFLKCLERAISCRTALQTIWFIRNSWCQEICFHFKFACRRLCLFT